MGLSTSKIAAFLKPKRRWFQFSLATLFLVTTALAVWLSIWTSRARKQQRAVEAIEQRGGRVGYSYETKKGPGPPTPPGPQWLRDSLGIDYLDHVVGANLTGDTFTDTDLELLQGLPRLENLALRSANVTDAGLVHLRSVHHVFYLDLVSDRITDAGLANLEALPRLENLSLDSPNITDAGLAHLEGLHRLEFVGLCSEKITDAGLAHLQDLRELKSLSLGCSITDAGMQHLTRLTKLRWLRSRGSRDDTVKRNVLDALRSPTLLDFVDVPLLDVCDYLQDLHRIKLQIDDVALKDAKIDRLIKVTHKTKAGGPPLRTALHSLLEPLGLDWYVGEGALVITTRDVVARRHAGIEMLQQALPNLKEVEIDW
jgi:hypothetical protein